MICCTQLPYLEPTQLIVLLFVAVTQIVLR